MHRAPALGDDVHFPASDLQRGGVIERVDRLGRAVHGSFYDVFLQVREIGVVEVRNEREIHVSQAVDVVFSVQIIMIEKMGKSQVQLPAGYHASSAHSHVHPFLEEIGQPSLVADLHVRRGGHDCQGRCFRLFADQVEKRPRNGRIRDAAGRQQELHSMKVGIGNAAVNRCLPATTGERSGSISPWHGEVDHASCGPAPDRIGANA